MSRAAKLKDAAPGLFPPLDLPRLPPTANHLAFQASLLIEAFGQLRELRAMDLGRHRREHRLLPVELGPPGGKRGGSNGYRPFPPELAVILLRERFRERVK